MVSVLIPVYNQYERLNIVLKYFNKQSYKNHFEVIVIDDGSKEIDYEVIEKYSKDTNYSLKFYVNEKNMGRAATRNKALEMAKGDYIIFCDSDRFPSATFIEDHVSLLNEDDNILSVGKVMETYCDISDIMQSDENVLARKALYYKLISNLFNHEGKTDSSLSWLAALSGNMAIKRNVLNQMRFDKDFMNWGFEHFELGYRLRQADVIIRLNSGAENYHIAHERESQFYETNLRESHALFYRKHSTLDVQVLIEFILGKISLQEYEALVSGNKEWMADKKKPIYNKLINM